MYIILFIVLVLSLSIIRVYPQSNYIKEHDFQNYPNLIFNTNNLNVSNTTISSRSWFVQNHSSMIEIKKFSRPPTTFCAQLTTLDPINLCQNVSLQVGSKYMLSYSVFSNVFTNMVFFVSFNNQTVSSLLVPLANNFSHATFSFFAKTKNIKICFRQTHSGLISTSVIKQYGGGLIDNVSLVLVQKQIISCEYAVDQRQLTLTLYGNISYNQDIAQHIQQYYKFFTGYPVHQFKLLKIFSTADGYLGLSFTFDFDFELKTFQGYSDSNSNQTQFQFVFPHYKNKRYYSIKVLDKALQFPNAFLCWTGLVLKKLVTWLRILFVSYFIAIAVDNQCLALFYVLLRPTTMPQFAKNIYYQTANILMGQSDLQYTLEILKVNFDGISIQNVPQNILQQIDGEPWFGSFGFSSKFIEGNISNLFCLLLLVFKNLIFRLLFKLFAPTSVKRVMYGQPSKLGQLLLVEFVYMTPTMIPGLLMDILTPANNTKEYLYKGCGFLVLFTVISTFFYYVIITILSKKVRIQGNDDVPKYKVKIEFQQDAMVILKLLFLPFAVTGNYPLFMSLVTVAIISQVFFLIVLVSNGMSYKKMFLYLAEILAWTIHHLVFILFWLGEEDPDLGLVSISSLMLIFSIEIIKIFCRLYSFFQKGRIFYKKVKKEQKMLDKRSEELKNQNQQKQKNKFKSKSMRQIQLEQKRIKLEEEEVQIKTFWNWVANKRQEHHRTMRKRSRQFRLKQQQQERIKQIKEEQQKKKKELDNPSVLTRISSFMKVVKPSNTIKDKIKVEQIHDDPEQIIKAPRRELVKLEDDIRNKMMDQKEKSIEKFQRVSSKFLLRKKEVQKNDEQKMKNDKLKEIDKEQVEKTERRVIVDLREENNLKRALYGVPLIEPQIQEEEVPRRKMIQQKKKQ